MKNLIKEHKEDNIEGRPYLHTKICNEERYNEFMENHWNLALKDYEQEKKHMENQADFSDNHIPWYEYHQNFLKTSKENGYTHIKEKPSKKGKEEELDNKSYISIDVEQSKKFMEELLSNPFPKVYSLQFTKIEHLPINAFLILLGSFFRLINLEKVIPAGINQLLLCHNLKVKFELMKKELNKLWSIIKDKVQMSITLQGFQLKDSEFNKILENWMHLEKICVKNWYIMPEGPDKRGRLNLNFKELRKSQALKHLILCDNKLGKDWLKSIIKDIEGDESEQNTILLPRLRELDLSGNQRRPFESKYNIFKSRYNYEKQVKGIIYLIFFYPGSVLSS